MLLEEKVEPVPLDSITESNVAVHLLFQISEKAEQN